MTDRDVERFWRKVQKQGGDGCWLWTAGKRDFGYGQFHWFTSAGEYTTGRAHRFSWELHHGPIPKELCVLHTCDVPACVRPDHLWLGTRADNHRDMDAKGRRARQVIRRGVRNANAKLTDEKVREIRGLADSGMSGWSIARQFGVGQPCISDIVRRVTWRHVE